MLRRSLDPIPKSYFALTFSLKFRLLSDPFSLSNKPKSRGFIDLDWDLISNYWMIGEFSDSHTFGKGASSLFSENKFLRPSHCFGIELIRPECRSYLLWHLTVDSCIKVSMTSSTSDKQILLRNLGFKASISESLIYAIAALLKMRRSAAKLNGLRSNYLFLGLSSPFWTKSCTESRSNCFF